MFTLTMSKQSALAQLKACNEAMTANVSSEIRYFAIKGRNEALEILRKLSAN